MRPFVLVNTNISHPPVTPVGMEYVGHAVAEAGIPVEVLDLAFEPDWQPALKRKLSSAEPLAVGIAVRNTDDCSFASRQSFLPWISELVQEVKRLTDAPAVIGGVGFSVYPESIVELTGADFGIDGDGEEATCLLLKCLSLGDDFSNLPNLVYRHHQRIIRNPRAEVDLQRLPLWRRRLFNNPRYQREGAMVGVETAATASSSSLAARRATAAPKE